MAVLKILNAATATNGAPVARATGSITTVAKASLVDGETFTLNDGRQSVVFEFDVNGTGVTAGRVRVDVSTDTTADEVRDRIITAINNYRYGGEKFRITASSGGAATVALKNDYPGTQGNTASSETVANVGFAVTNMAGATAGGFALYMGINPGKPYEGFQFAELANVVFELASVAGSGTMTCTIKLWAFNRSGAGEYIPLGTHSLDASRGVLNEGNPIGEHTTDKLGLDQVIYDLRHFTYVYPEITAIGGTSTAVSAWLRSS